MRTDPQPPVVASMRIADDLNEEDLKQSEGITTNVDLAQTILQAAGVTADPMSFTTFMKSLNMPGSGTI
ncbi:hypothetical protein [Arthrobacter monumenti]